MEELQINQILKLLKNVEIELNNISEYYETNYFTIVGELRVIENLIELLQIENNTIELQFNRLYKLNQSLKGDN